MADEKKAVSFGFSKKIETKVKQKSALDDGKSNVKEETDFVVSLEGKSVKSLKPKDEPKELIIPLIRENQWNVPSTDRDGQDGVKKSSLAEKLEQKMAKTDRSTEVEGRDDDVSRAAREVMEDAARSMGKWEDRGNDRKYDDLTVPLMSLNKAPEGFETDSKLDVSIRPDEASLDDYEAMPVEAFGMAALRGMGWTPEEGIGRTFKQHVDPLQLQVRPKGLGLGAVVRPTEDKNQRPLKPGETRKEEDTRGLVPGAHVLILAGPHRDMYGKVESLNGETARAVVSLALGGQTLDISENALQVVSKEEYKKNSHKIKKEVNGNSSREKERKKERHRDREDEDRHHREKGRRKEDRKDDRRKDRDDRRDREKESDRKRKHDDDHYRESKSKSKRKEDDYESVSSKEHRSSPCQSRPVQQACWMRPQLRVRVIDKHYKNGKYYNAKVAIDDVTDAETCTCVTEDGRVIDGVKQPMLETVIPKTEPGYILVVGGKYKGQKAEIIGKDKKNCIATVQFLPDREKTVKVSYDDICQYLGDVETY
ncbi:G-patch domain and KOW motifs-containing protein-like isoform X2 [Branchiostoma floridae]|uniref:G-patch domain and KOW motifs-containing protein-like isoform X2 n=1 Tax=Branchiostoma floridae TaxID=7739 RepID=A0A9J7MPH6_BRAFL|nr:G-patch domain and KOW motifs-containing protein-like isoform X2 [Branchiostoma floridae]